MIKNLKKAFTIIELVIVIAVIAILAAVMIPTYSSLVEKANQSVDIQAVKQMNTILALDEVDSIKSIANVHEALNAEGLDSENFTPLASNTYFYWLEKENRIVYVDNDKKVIYPEEYKGDNLINYCSLNGVINVSENNQVSPGQDGKVTIENEEQLYYLSQCSLDSVKEIKFADNATEIDAHGADISFNFDDSSNAKTIKIIGASGGTTIKNAVSLNKSHDIFNNTANGTRGYATGFVSYVGKNVGLEISNITIDGGIFGNLETGGVGALIGRIEQGNNNSEENLKINNCKVQKATINGKNKVGALIGSFGGKRTVEITDCKVIDCTVNCSEGESGKAIGCVYGYNAILTIDKEFNQWVTNTKLNLIDTPERKIVDASGLIIKEPDESIISANCEKIVQEYDEKNPNNKDDYRMFNSNAFMTAQLYNVTNMKITINTNNINQSENIESTLSINLPGTSINSMRILKFFTEND